MRKPDETETWLGIQKIGRPLVVAGTVLGVGLGGFFDGIVLHQLLQWHNMVSSYPDPSVANDFRLNVVADGLFHTMAYVFTILGVSLLLRAWRLSFVPASRRTLFGSVILGWGIFNVVEGIVDHQLLGIHHVWPAGPGPVLLWDAAFLLWGLLFIGGGYAIVRGDAAVTPTPQREQAGQEQTS
ncbi:DUF2243 domain-containing protein [Natrinema salaciae]|uniref:Uncharacterized membrane protein n=1 Tax=Natrinema salaciae TaxID=1186196 RepID=A0A1H9SRZ0_9EURY|nr:DUF2243 domain-containing protein [Natrinema salaciae]SER87089.1 Uncharacterized membrane protein [Natrinema salaciae]